MRGALGDAYSCWMPATMNSLELPDMNELTRQLKDKFVLAPRNHSTEIGPALTSKFERKWSSSHYMNSSSIRAWSRQDRIGLQNTPASARRILSPALPRTMWDPRGSIYRAGRSPLSLQLKRVSMLQITKC